MKTLEDLRNELERITKEMDTTKKERKVKKEKPQFQEERVIGEIKTNEIKGIKINECYKYPEKNVYIDRLGLRSFVIFNEKGEYETTLKSWREIEEYFQVTITSKVVRERKEKEEIKPEIPEGMEAVESESKYVVVNFMNKVKLLKVNGEYIYRMGIRTFNIFNSNKEYIGQIRTYNEMEERYGKQEYKQKSRKLVELPEGIMVTEVAGIELIYKMKNGQVIKYKDYLVYREGRNFHIFKEKEGRREYIDSAVGFNKGFAELEKITTAEVKQ